MAYKYLTAARINTAIKKYGLRLNYTKGQKTFGFLDLKTETPVGNSLQLNNLHSLSIQQWRDAASKARTESPLDSSAQEVRDFVSELPE